MRMHLFVAAAWRVVAWLWVLASLLTWVWLGARIYAGMTTDEGGPTGASFNFYLILSAIVCLVMAGVSSTAAATTEDWYRGMLRRVGGLDA